MGNAYYEKLTHGFHIFFTKISFAFLKKKKPTHFEIQSYKERQRSSAHQFAPQGWTRLKTGARCFFWSPTRVVEAQELDWKEE